VGARVGGSSSRAEDKPGARHRGIEQGALGSRGLARELRELGDGARHTAMEAGAGAQVARELGRAAGGRGVGARQGSSMASLREMRKGSGWAQGVLHGGEAGARWGARKKMTELGGRAQEDGQRKQGGRARHWKPGVWSEHSRRR
jgi:hypothetical protein